MKMGRRLRCSSVTYRFKTRSLLVLVRLGPPCRRPILIATKHARISGTGHKRAEGECLTLPAQTSLPYQTCVESAC